jgi:predicted DNA-binding transcriptional regulator AlpA
MPQRKPHQLFEVVLSPAIVMERVGMDEAGILAGVNAGTFPKPIKLDGRVVWKDQDIQKWIAQRVAAGDKKTAALNRYSPALGQLIDVLAAEDAKDYLAKQRAEARLRKP